MSASAAAVSRAEVKAVQDGIANDVREDGRTLLQRRPMHLSTRAGTDVAAGEVYNGSYVEVDIGGTVVLAAASPSVADGCAVATSSSSASAAPTNEQPERDEGEGCLFISIDAVPAVLDLYAGPIGGRSVGRYRRDYLSFLASTIQQAFGAAQVSVRDDAQTGVAEVEAVVEEEREEEEEAYPLSRSTAASCSGVSAVRDRRPNCGFPATDLYIGSGFGFHVHVDVHVLQASGGNLLSSIAYAVNAALRVVQLPNVNLHTAPGDAGGVAVEVDRGSPYRRTVDWSQLPLLCVMLLSPTGHYVVDPSLREECALPQQMHIAANKSGQITFFRYQQLPSRRGNTYQLQSTTTTKAEGGAAGLLSDLAQPTSLNMTDCWAVLADAVHICQSMQHDIEEALHSTA